MRLIPAALAVLILSACAQQPHQIAADQSARDLAPPTQRPICRAPWPAFEAMMVNPPEPAQEVTATGAEAKMLTDFVNSDDPPTDLIPDKVVVFLRRDGAKAMIVLVKSNCVAARDIVAAQDLAKILGEGL